MSDSITRFMHYRFNTQPQRQGVEPKGLLVVAGVVERAELARLLVVDTSPWHEGACRADAKACEDAAKAGHKAFVAPFGIPLADTLVVDVCADVYWERPPARAGGRRLLVPARDGVAHGTREAFVSWAGASGHQMLKTVDAVRDGNWAGVEG